MVPQVPRASNNIPTELGNSVTDSRELDSNGGCDNLLDTPVHASGGRSILEGNAQQAVLLHGNGVGTGLDGDKSSVDDDVLVSNNGLDLAGNLDISSSEVDGLDAGTNLVGTVEGGGQDAASGLGGEGSVGDLNLLGDLVGENGDSEDGGEAGNGEDGSDDNSNLHALDGTFNVGQLSLEAGHGGSSFSFHFWF